MVFPPGRISAKPYPWFWARLLKKSCRLLNTSSAPASRSSILSLLRRCQKGGTLVTGLPTTFRSATARDAFKKLGVVVLELTAQSAIESRVLKLPDHLLRAKTTLQDARTQTSADHDIGAGRTLEDPLVASSNLIEECLSEVLAISRLLSAPAPLTARLIMSSRLPAVSLPPINAPSTTSPSPAFRVGQPQKPLEKGTSSGRLFSIRQNQ
jgi:hypothetical protein